MVDAIKKKPQESSATAEEKKVISEQWGLDFIKVLGVWCEGLQESPFKRLGRCPVESWLNDSTKLHQIQPDPVECNFCTTRTWHEHDIMTTARMTAEFIVCYFMLNCTFVLMSSFPSVLDDQSCIPIGCEMGVGLNQQLPVQTFRWENTAEITCPIETEKLEVDLDNMIDQLIL